MSKTADYTKKAIANYNNKFDRTMINLPKGTKEKIRTLTGKSVNAFINELVEQELKKHESDQMPF